MDKTKLSTRVYELQSYFKLIKWNEEGLTDFTPELESNLERIAHYAERLAEEAYRLAAELRKEPNQ